MKILITTILLLFSFNSYAVYFRHLGIKDGLSQLSIYSIYQDKLGRMWFGTQEGVSIYNGERTVSYKDNSHISGFDRRVQDNSVMYIAGLTSGDVFYTLGSYLIRYKLDEDNFQCLRKGVKYLANFQDQVFMVANDSIYRWDEASETMTLYCKTGLKSLITCLYVNADGTVYVGTNYGVHFVRPDGKLTYIFPDKNINALLKSSTGELWIGTRIRGLYCLGTDNRIREYLHNPDDPTSLSHNHIRAIEEDCSGNIWIGTFMGLNKYSPSTDTFTAYRKDNIRGGLTHSSIFSLLIDKQSILWVGTYYGGVNYFNSEHTPFVYYSDDPKRTECLNFPFVSSMVEDRNGNLWICTEGGGLNFLNRSTGQFTWYTAASTGNAIRHNNLKSIAYDADNHCLYIGTYTGGLSRFDISTGRFTNYLDIWPLKGRGHRSITCIRVHRGEVIFIDESGLFRLNRDTQLPEPLFPGSNSYDYFGNKFIIDTNNNLWLSHISGVMRIPLDNPRGGKIYELGTYGLGASDISGIVETCSGDIFLSTEGAGVYCYESDVDSFLSYTAAEDHLLSDFCYSLIEAPSGKLIISSDKGLSFLDPNTGRVTYSAGIGYDLPFSAINSGCGMYVSHNGEIFVGSADGLISFYENEFTDINDEYELYFSDIFIHNQRVIPSGESKILNKVSALTNSLTLGYTQNNLIFAFASSNYLHSSNSSLYEYILQGFDQQWISTNNTRITYTNLPPGHYTLRVREMDTNTTHPREIYMNIHIRYPFYNTPLAWVIYMVLFASLLYLFLAFRQRQIRLQTSLEYERKEKEYITSLNKSKIAFFTNISHEFRTPLSLIITQVEMLLQNKSITVPIRGKIQKLYHSASQMRKLVNELLDFQKLEQRQTHLTVSRGNLVVFVRDIVTLFDEKAETNNIRYTFNTSAEEIEAWFDPEQMRKVVFNLLSNAFKFTPCQGFIEVVLGYQEEKIILKVIDNGIGVDPKDMANIFERYYQAANSLLPGSRELGTGLGLALSKDIVELHGGSIQVESKLGYGSIFIVTLPIGKQHFEDNPYVKFADDTVNPDMEEGTLPDAGFIETLSDAGSLMSDTGKEERYKILLVEDNEELLQTLAEIFTHFYQVILARDGEEGLQKALSEKPGIIVSDVMMPRMNGDKMCFELKGRIDTCHIPIVLLTAQSSTEKNIEGLLKGADDYITKPFNARILLTRCNTLLRNRLLLQQQYRQGLESNIQLLSTNETDKVFLEKAEEIIERYLSDTDFSIDKLASEIAMSRRSLYYKFKQLTGMTPNDFILNYKLKKAALLLTNSPTMQIVEISDTLGFSSSRYFSRCFKAQFNVAPMEYRKSK